ncbi:hypothetical protein NIES4074_48040 [Cylindrospermum sp. NIES-4074]|nr:hypothetical protein NIES4074_48040 [Cylindrospermum sp. NIES-4074]
MIAQLQIAWLNPSLGDRTKKARHNGLVLLLTRLAVIRTEAICQSTNL